MVVKERIPAIPITEIEQSAFCRTDDDLAAKSLAEEFDAGVRWQKLPVSYMRMSPAELDARIAQARAKLGARAVVLGHHYQRDEIIKYADYRGDSVQPIPIRRIPSRRPIHHLLRRPLYGRNRRHPQLPRPASHTPQPSRRLLYGGYGAH